jgi:uncharacterized protein YukE
MIPAPDGSSCALGSVAVTPDPGLLSADPDAMRSAATTLIAQGRTLDTVGKSARHVSSALVAEWKGSAALDFEGHMNDMTSYVPAAAESMAGLYLALNTLAGQIEEAQTLARQAMSMAVTANASMQSFVQAHASSTTPLTTGQVNQVDSIAGQQSQAVNLMDQANQMARRAWAGAAAAFDMVTAQSMSVTNQAVAVNVAQFSKYIDQQGINQLFIMEAQAADGFGDGGYVEGEDGEVMVEGDALGEPLSEFPELPAELQALQGEKVDGEKIDPAVAADAEAMGVAVGWSNSMSIEQAYEEAALDPATSGLMAGSNLWGDTGPAGFQDSYWDPKANGGKGDWKWPPNRGADRSAGVEPDMPMHAGESIDRFGGNSGTFFSPAGTPFGERSLPPTSLLPDSNGNSPYHSYVLTSNWDQPDPAYRAQTSIIAPDFNQPGGGIQIEFINKATGEPASVNELLKAGYLEPGS